MLAALSYFFWQAAMAKTALITGLLKASAKRRRWNWRGNDLVLAAHKPDRLNATAAEVQSLGRQALATP
jgi:hypothetical protein